MMKIIKEFFTIVMFTLLICISTLFALVSLAVFSLTSFISTLGKAVKKERINEYGFVEKSIN